MKQTALLAAACCVLLSAQLVGADDAFNEARSLARKYAKTPGELLDKEIVIGALVRDDLPRSAQLLVDWACKSAKFKRKDLVKAHAEAKEDFEKTEKILLKKYEKMPPAGHKDAKNDKEWWQKKKTAFEEAASHIDVEAIVMQRIGRAFEKLTSKEAASWVAKSGLGKLQKAKGAELAQVGAVRFLLATNLPEGRAASLKAAGPSGLPRIQTEVFHFLGQHKTPGAMKALVKGLGYPHPSARRQAIWALREHNDLQAVKPLIDAFAKADGMVAQELEDALHYFTGQSFEADGAVWKRWWKDSGEAWIAKKEAKRYEPVKTKHSTTGTSFYDIPTASTRIVFVLDRSGSMAKAAGEKSQKLKEPKGPTTGGEGKRKSDGEVAGSTKMEVAKNQLARSIRNLAANVHFNVVFYGEDIQVWQDPPHLLAATKANKEAAIKWFMAIKADGATPMFAAMMKALEYAIPPDAATGKKIDGGADTIYLLSDGSPTEDGELLTEEQKDERYGTFLEANRIARCTVHSIGVGPKHAKSLMRKIAEDGGGEYRAVGME